MPISTRRVTALGASFVCRVLKTRCPVRAARIAISAVSRSRISPTIIMSGSCLNIAFKPVAKVMPARGLIWDWLTPSSLYSTGSSTVMIFFVTVLSLLSAAYSVVVLPLPVGPVTKIIPNGLSINTLKSSSSFLGRPSSFRLNIMLPLSKILKTTFSPPTVGNEATLRSNSFPSLFTAIWPSWGMRFSAIFISASTFILDTTADSTPLGTVMISCRIPSIL